MIGEHRHLATIFSCLTTTTTHCSLHCFSAVACTLHLAPSPFLSSTKPEITEDGNATVPIVGGDGGEEGGDSGLASAPHDEAAVTQHHTTMSAEEHIAQHHFPGEETSVPDAAPEAQESASTTQKEDDNNAHGERLQPSFSLPVVVHVVHDCFVPQVVIARHVRVYRDDTLLSGIWKTKHYRIALG